ncbi:energy-coupling factor transporter ATPase [Streptococcus sp. DD12]|uniref:energy-coupling factor transporter ATPase n=1 Tax=Streptococcus sp. DD12 TaxID=1777880 RepID=UPI00079560D7|nr:energy-coupling factor transporter ATPase [Streptococcus sp. DD12]KXT76098.1 ATPase component of general energizing module of ECF transporter [Streptococcus sp. DD12]
MGISLNHVDYTYQEGTPFEGRALFDVTLTIPSGSYTAFIGHTGSGKSTIMQLLNGLHLPTAGSIQVDDFQITSETKSKQIRSLRKKVGLVFQFAETQLFAETVLKDVAFGPQNFGLTATEAEKIAKNTLSQVGIDETLWDKNPFELSGGQMRRVAIAGILALEPEVLVLDEPTAGLDPKGRKELMQLFDKLHQAGLTIVLVTHLMDDVANFADQVYVMEKGHVVSFGSPQQVFQDVAFLKEKQLGVPKITELAYRLREKGWPMEQLPITIEAFKELITHE